MERLKSVDVPRLAKVEGMHHDGRGLYLKAKPPGAVSWILRYMLNGKAHTMGLGSFPDVSLKRAREKALEARQLRAEGVDPVAARRAERVARRAAADVLTFKLAAERFIASKESGWRHRGKTADQWRAAFRDWVYPLIGSMAIANVDTAAVLSILSQPVNTKDGERRFWEARAETASRCRARIENVLDFARASGWRSGDNPADWATLKFALPKRVDVRPVQHHDAMPYEQVPGFVARLREKPALSARALEFTILTVARTTEVRGMTWGELDQIKKVWTIPGSRMKAKKEHRVPLAERALAILSAQASGDAGDFVFPGVKPGRPLSENTMLKLLQDEMGDVTVHGFRSAFSTWAREQTDFPREIAEAALAHAVGDAVERAYARTDFITKRRSLLEAWERFCDSARPIDR
jgi:integrase